VELVKASISRQSFRNAQQNNLPVSGQVDVVWKIRPAAVDQDSLTCLRFRRRALELAGR
jgi:hypothetical protein